jgi:signal transduction histidine kinase
MRVLFPQSLAGRLIFWLLASLLVVQVGFMLFQEYDRRQDVLRAVEKGTASQAISIARILENVEPGNWPDAVIKSSNKELSLRVDVDRRFIELRAPRIIVHNKEVIKEKLEKALEVHSGSTIENIRIHKIDKPNILFDKEFIETSNDRPISSFSFFMPDDLSATPASNIRGVSVKLVDGRWLNADIRHDAVIAFKWQDFIPLMASAVLLILVVIIVVNLETRSLRTLAIAADRLGRGEKLDPLREAGPKETRVALRAFNQMGDRISRFVRDRTQMLAAMSHDLRTPLTSMRLRVEELEDETLRAHLISSIEEMKQMAEASLEFARADAIDEPSLQTNLVALVNDLVEEFQKFGQAVELSTTTPIMIVIRPLAMKRAIRNLIENAVRYGSQAKIDIMQTSTETIVQIRDKGPGIPEADLERVFEPFTRLETSRNRETGGAGLGLSIARSIINSHGGELILSNAKQGGLIAKITLY